jgi:predicted XRE-type DNA-binding protein
METATGRPKGMANLSDDIKLGILQQKKLQIYPQQVIANDFGISRKTVNQMTEDKLSPQAKIKLDSFVDKLGQAREKVIQRINEKLDNNDFKDGVYPNLLNAVNTNYRLETNQSTSNVAVLDVAQTINQTLQIAVKLHRADASEPLPTRAEIVDSFAQLCARNGVQPDESLIDFSLLDGVENP